MGESLGASTVILADVSGSMKERAMEGTKIARLKDALKAIWAETPGAVLIAFSFDARRVETPKDLPEPSGGTDLHLALMEASRLAAAQVIVISDGRPSDPERCLEIAAEIPGTIDALYIGPETDVEAIQFMHRLGRAGAGDVVVADLTKVKSIVAPLRGMLGLPAPIAV